MAIIYYSKPDCPLCDEGLEIVVELAGRCGLDVRKVNINRHPTLTEKYRHRIPVVCLEDTTGEDELSSGRLTLKSVEGRLRSALEAGKKRRGHSSK